MPAPYNYNVGNPMAGFLQGFAVVDQMEQMRAQRQAQQQEQERKAAFQQSLMQWQENPTRKGFAELQVAFPELSKSAQPLADLYNEDQQRAMFNVGLEVLNVDEGKRGDLLEAKAQAFENTGDKQSAQALRDAATLARQNPKAAEVAVRAFMVQANGDTYEKLYDEPEKIQVFNRLRDEVGQEAALRAIGADDFITTVLPNNGFYAGPKSGLVEVMGGLRQEGASSGAPTGATTTNEPGRILDKALKNGFIDMKDFAALAAGNDSAGIRAYEMWLKGKGIKQVAEAKTLNGKTYYKINGQWYDNLEGR